MAVNNGTRKKMCYYKSRTSEADALMLRDFVDFCDREATREVFLTDWQSKKRVICERAECWDKATKDLKKLRARQQHSREVNRDMKKLEKAGLSKGQAFNKLVEKYGLAGFNE